jgi:REP element-mobilizing transposase RayT
MNKQLEKVAQASPPVKGSVIHSRDGCVTFDLGHPLNIKHRNLPHWEQSGVTYFITFRLSDSLPAEQLRKWKYERKNWLKNHKMPYSNDELKEYSRLFSCRINYWLDKGNGKCILKNSNISEIVVNTLKYFDGIRYNLGEWVIMPNHVHSLITPLDNFSMSEIMHSIKSFSAHEINKELNTKGRIWQDESYDHIVRDEKELKRFEEYIISNPVTTKLKTGYKCSKK